MDKKIEILQAALNDSIGIATIFGSGTVVELQTIESKKRFTEQEHIDAFYDSLDFGYLEPIRGQQYRITIEGKQFLNKNIT